MINTVTLCGTLASKPINAELKGNLTHAISVEVEGEKFYVWIWQDIAGIIEEKYSIGTLARIKGKLTNHDGNMYIVASRISFITEEENHD